MNMYWVKFKDKSPTSWSSKDDEELLKGILSMIKREPELKLEWIVKEK